jgi:hypothetical protein
VGAPEESAGSCAELEQEVSKEVLPAGWKLPEEWRAEAIKMRPDFSDRSVTKTAKAFCEYYRTREIKKDALQWEMAWKKWVRNQRVARKGVNRSGKKKLPESRECPACGQPGVLSHNTMAGPYFCRKHFSI